jgi:hypothetical protein
MSEPLTDHDMLMDYLEAEYDRLDAEMDKLLAECEETDKMLADAAKALPPGERKRIAKERMELADRYEQRLIELQERQKALAEKFILARRVLAQGSSSSRN